jgi:hypothetical protein
MDGRERLYPREKYRVVLCLRGVVHNKTRAALRLRGVVREKPRAALRLQGAIHVQRLPAFPSTRLPLPCLPHHECRGMPDAGRHLTWIAPCKRSVARGMGRGTGRSANQGTDRSSNRGTGRGMGRSANRGMGRRTGRGTGREKQGKRGKWPSNARFGLNFNSITPILFYFSWIP